MSDDNLIPMQPVECSHSSLCPLAHSILTRLNELLFSAAETAVNVNVLKRDPSELPHFAVVAVETWLNHNPNIALTIDDVMDMKIKGFTEYLARLTKDDPESFAYVTQKIFTLYGYEEQFMNDW